MLNIEKDDQEIKFNFWVKLTVFIKIENEVLKNSAFLLYMV